MESNAAIAWNFMTDKMSCVCIMIMYLFWDGPQISALPCPKCLQLRLPMSNSKQYYLHMIQLSTNQPI